MNTLISADNTWMLFAIMAAIAAAAIWLEQTYKWAAKLSSCVICLLMAMLLSNCRVIPTEAGAYDFVWSYVVPLSIPLLLYKANIRKIWRESGRMLGIFLIGGLGTLSGGIIAFYLLRHQLGIAAARSAASMFTGTYVGGSVNLVAMSEATSAGADLVSASIVADNLLMALYFFILIALPGIRWISEHFSHPIIDRQREEQSNENHTSKYWAKKEISLVDIAKGFSIACVIVAVSVQLAGFFIDVIPTGNIAGDLLNGLLGNKYLLITTITTLLATYFPDIFGNIGGAQEAGTYMINIFFAVIGAPASIVLIVREAPLLLVFAAIIIGMNMLFSLVLGRLFGYSIEEITVASNANIGGPTTSAAFAVSKGWKSLVVPAILVGTLGYVIGNYYGVILFTILK